MVIISVYPLSQHSRVIVARLLLAFPNGYHKRLSFITAQPCYCGYLVKSRHVMDRIEPEFFGLFCPDIADVFVGREPFERLQTSREVVG